MTQPELDRFLKKVRINEETGCWEWTGTINVRGYGSFGKKRIAHRSSYEHYVGLIAPRMEIDHKCMMKRCVNPEHLQQVTHCENNILAVQRKENFNSSKTHCKRGHEFSESNTIYDKAGRHCRTCKKLSGD